MDSDMVFWFLLSSTNKSACAFTDARRPVSSLSILSKRTVQSRAPDTPPSCYVYTQKRGQWASHTTTPVPTLYSTLPSPDDLGGEVSIPMQVRLIREVQQRVRVRAVGGSGR